MNQRPKQTKISRKLWIINILEELYSFRIVQRESTWEIQDSFIITVSFFIEFVSIDQLTNWLALVSLTILIIKIVNYYGMWAKHWSRMLSSVTFNLSKIQNRWQAKNYLHFIFLRYD